MLRAKPIAGRPPNLDGEARAWLYRAMTMKKSTAAGVRGRAVDARHGAQSYSRALQHASLGGLALALAQEAAALGPAAAGGGRNEVRVSENWGAGRAARGADRLCRRGGRTLRPAQWHSLGAVGRDPGARYHGGCASSSTCTRRSARGGCALCPPSKGSAPCSSSSSCNGGYTSGTRPSFSSPKSIRFTAQAPCAVLSLRPRGRLQPFQPPHAPRLNPHALVWNHLKTLSSEARCRRSRAARAPHHQVPSRVTETSRPRPRFALTARHALRCSPT